MKQAAIRLAMGTALSLSIACGGGIPTSTILPSPLPVAAATPTPAPAPTPEPTPTPCTQGLCEPKVVNDSPADRLTLRLYTIEDGQGNFISNPDPNNGITVGSIARIDATAKDADGKETNGLGSIQFFFNEPSLVKIAGGNGPQQRRLKVLKAGRLVCWAELDGVQSNLLTLYFTN